MAINFDALPDSIENSSGKIIPKGTYPASIERAEMKTPKVKEGGTQNPDYLNLMLKVTTPSGEVLGNIWDIISESTNNYAQYKLKRFVMALGIKITPGLTLELKDLVKIAPNVKLLIDINQDKKDPTKNQVDIFSGDIYYHISEASKVLGDENLFVDASDAEDTIFGTKTTPDFENVEY